MSRTQRKIIGALATVLATSALAPATSIAGQSATAPTNDLTDRTPTELGQAVGEPGEAGSAALGTRFARTPTELAQRVLPAAAADETASSGFDWGDAAIGAAAVLALGLAAAGGLVLMDRGARQRAFRPSRAEPVRRALSGSSCGAAPLLAGVAPSPSARKRVPDPFPQCGSGYDHE
jgi:hypothetical protein